VITGTALAIEARALDDAFERWTSTTCMGQDASCNVVANTAIDVGARFR
jgi:hypothetical protein